MTGDGEVVVDARGLRCPAPIIALARVARAEPPGTLVAVLATDPAAATDVPAWTRMRGHELLSSESDDDGALRLVVRLV